MCLALLFNFTSHGKKTGAHYHVLLSRLLDILPILPLDLDLPPTASNNPPYDLATVKVQPTPRSKGNGWYRRRVQSRFRKWGITLSSSDSRQPLLPPISPRPKAALANLFCVVTRTPTRPLDSNLRWMRWGWRTNRPAGGWGRLIFRDEIQHLFVRLLFFSLHFLLLKFLKG